MSNATQATIDNPIDGIDFSDTSFRVKPLTININQPMTQAEGAEKGKLRLSDGRQFSSITVALLQKPDLQRSFYTGAAGALNRKPANLVCFSRDMVRPDDLSREKQSTLCADCNKGDLAWVKWRETKLKADIPPCDAWYYSLFIDTVSKLPLQMYIRSKNKAPFEAGIEAIKTALKERRAQGLRYNYFDVTFKLSTTKILTGNLPSWVMSISDIQGTPEQDRDAYADAAALFTKPVRSASSESSESYESGIAKATEYIADMELDMDARP